MHKFSPLRWWKVFLGGLLLISFGFASSLGMRPVEALIPLAAVVGGLTLLTTFAGDGPRAFL